MANAIVLMTAFCEPLLTANSPQELFDGLLENESIVESSNLCLEDFLLQGCRGVFEFCQQRACLRRLELYSFKKHGSGFLDISNMRGIEFRGHRLKYLMPTKISSTGAFCIKHQDRFWTFAEPLPHLLFERFDALLMYKQCCDHLKRRPDTVVSLYIPPDRRVNEQEQGYDIQLEPLAVEKQGFSPVFVDVKQCADFLEVPIIRVQTALNNPGQTQIGDYRVHQFFPVK